MANPMRNIRIEKLTLNVGAGSDQDKLEKGIVLIERITGSKSVKTLTQERIPSWGLRKGLPIGAKITLRKSQAAETLKRILTARDNKLAPRNFDDKGNVNFGMVEYIYIPGMKYDPAIGTLGFNVTVTLERPGFRIKRRKHLKGTVAKTHRIKPEEAMEYMKQEFKVEVAEE